MQKLQEIINSLQICWTMYVMTVEVRDFIVPEDRLK